MHPYESLFQVVNAGGRNRVLKYLVKERFSVSHEESNKKSGIVAASGSWDLFFIIDRKNGLFMEARNHSATACSTGGASLCRPAVSE